MTQNQKTVNHRYYSSFFNSCNLQHLDINKTFDENLHTLLLSNKFSLKKSISRSESSFIVNETKDELQTAALCKPMLLSFLFLSLLKIFFGIKVQKLVVLCFMKFNGFKLCNKDFFAKLPNLINSKYSCLIFD